MTILALDCGRHGVKVAGEGIRDWFPSYVGGGRQLKLQNTLGPHDIIMTYQGEQYFIGSLGKNESYSGARMMTPSKAHMDTKLLALAAIAKQGIVGDVHLVTGQPIAVHEPANKEALRELLIGSHDLILNSKRCQFRISDVKVVAEGAPALWNLTRGKQGTYRGIDCGSRMMNYAQVVNGKYIDRLSGSLDYGAETVNTTPHELARRITADLSLHWPDTHPLILFGGYAETLLQPLSAYFPNITLAHDPIYANANAYFELGKGFYRAQLHT